MREKTPAGGFSLLELMLVLLLMGLAYGLASPLLGAGSAGTDVKAAARQIGAGLRRARDVAVTNQAEAVLTLDLEGHNFIVSGDPRIYHLPERVSLSLFTAQSEVVRERQGAIRFFADGSSTGGRVSIAFEGLEHQIDVDWLTGKVQLD